MTGPRHISRYTAANVAATDDGRLFSPSFSRNYEPIRAALHPRLVRAQGRVLEIGSGPGQHVAHLARDYPDLTWQPSDIDAGHHASAVAWGKWLGVENLAAPVFLDASTDWGTDPALAGLAGVIASNVIHIAPWAVAEGIVRGAGRALGAGGWLAFYGPFREGGRHTGEGNASFDAGLRAENPDWGVRDLDEVAALASAAGLGPAEVTRLPSNNLLVVFGK